MSSKSPSFIFLFLFSILTGHHVYAQHYVFIESERQQKFHLKWEGKTAVSTDLGFLILSGLKADTLAFSIVFPQTDEPESFFQLRLDGRDQGFYLRRNEGKFWVLFNRSSMELIPERAAQHMVRAEAKIDSAVLFGDMLAQVTNDPGLLKKETTAGQDAKALVKAQGSSKPPVQKLSSVKQGADLDNPLFLPVDLNVRAVSTEQKDLPAAVPNGLQREAPAEGDQPKAVPVKPNGQEVAVITKTRIACSRPTADAKEVQGLVKKLLGIADADGQIALAEKHFKTRCFNTAQAMEIGNYFTDEPSRLRLYMRLYPLVSDPAFFGAVEAQFKEEQHIRTLRALYLGR